MDRRRTTDYTLDPAHLDAVEALRRSALQDDRPGTQGCSWLLAVCFLSLGTIFAALLYLAPWLEARR